MTPYFDDEQNRQRFQEILDSWKGTPYRHFTAVKGCGADCTLFIASALVEAGILDGVSYSYYPRDWHLNTQEEMVLGYIEKNVREHLAPGFSIDRLPAGSPLQWGDVMGFALTKMNVTNHLGILVENNMMLGAISCRDVREVELRDYWMRHMSCVFRLMREN